MSDNFYFSCPAKSGPGFREITNYSPNVALNEYISVQNNIERDDEYRIFLQKNAEQVEKNEWETLRSKYSCFPNECIFDNKMTLVNPSVFSEEMARWNSTPRVDSKKYFSEMNKLFRERANNNTKDKVFYDKDVLLYRKNLTCAKSRDYNAF